MKKTGMLAAALGGLLAGWVSAAPKTATELSVTSPDNHNTIELKTAPLRYAVLRDGRTLVAETPIALTVDGKDLGKAEAAFRTDGAQARSGTVAAPVYKKDSVDLSRNEDLADFGDWGVRLVARNDGVAYRFETRRSGEITVQGERGGVTVPDAKARCWLNYGMWPGCEETVPVALNAGDIKTDGSDKRGWAGNNLVYLPFGYTVGGKTIVVTESDVHDYPIWDLKRGADGGAGVRLESTFHFHPKETVHTAGWGAKEDSKTGGRWVQIRSFENYLTKTAGTRTFPWRTFILGDSPAALPAADIVYALAREQVKGDFSWVKPGKVAWDWWNAFDNLGDPEGCTTKTYERFIDFAAKNGIEYVIFDEGWSEKLDIWRFSPKVDVPHLIDYADKRGVGIILWMAWAQVCGDEARVASHFAKLGAKGFKVDFMDRGDAQCERFLWTFAEECRKNRMLVDYHGAHRPTGMGRAYPNVVNFEGVHGLEQMKFFRGQPMMENDVMAFYLRLTAGPMDYTPGAMKNHRVGAYPRMGTSEGKDIHRNPGSEGTRCRQMAMMTLYEAPLQMLSDSPTNYERNMESFRFMAQTPVVWADTVGLPGDPESCAAVARKSRDGAWYAAAMTNSKARDYALDTAFLGTGSWTAEIFRDAPDSDVEPTHYVHETRTVAAGDKLSFRLAAGGAFVIRFTLAAKEVAFGLR